ncbi:MAG: YlxR family protein [Negativicutes bacterium]|nr:YlxR family protein [Negativicutes bacterium]
MKLKKTPQRMCVGCQIMKSKKELLRVVRTPDGDIVLDTTGKKAGRGAYLCNSDDCLTKAVKGKRLERALQHAVAPEVFEQLRAGIAK